MDNSKIMPLVSIVVPCYNGEGYIERCIESIINQSYKKIELIIINDGSTDSTRSILEEYKIKTVQLERYLVIDKENGGQASAINAGLKYVEGQYLVWLDADDELLKNNIEEKVKFFFDNPSYKWVQCGAYIRDEETNLLIKEYVPYVKETKDMFWNLLKEKNIFFPPGIYMVKTEALWKVIPEKRIIESRLGQNWQLLLPLAYKYECGVIEKKLFVYYIRKTSHSHIDKSYEEKLKFYHDSSELLLNIIENMGVKDSKIERFVKDKYYKLILKNDVKENQRKYRKLHFEMIKEPGIEDYMLYIILKVPFLSDTVSRYYKNKLR
ncbi:glycosyltransferase family 2 protein [Laedolimicola intestinihominis]|uniref:Glycosyltransferase family A protein n=1 Tax=Laedolimicola intestinihominis TaxID=3133166 RepID=A0ABV1FGC0_9FIRM